MKRLVIGVFASVLTIVGVAPAASAASSSPSHHVSKSVKANKAASAKAAKIRVAKIIDWDAPTKSSGTGYSASRIDWD